MKDQTCIHCSHPLSKHFQVERVDDVLAPPVLICPVCTFRPRDETATPKEAPGTGAAA